MAHTRVLGKTRVMVSAPYWNWSYVKWLPSSQKLYAGQYPMRLLLRRDGRSWGRFVFVSVIRRFWQFLSNATDMLCKRSWGPMRRSSLASDEGDFGQPGKALTFFSTSELSWASSSVGVPDQSLQDGKGPDGPDCGGHPDDQEAEIGLAEVDIGAEQLDRRDLETWTRVRRRMGVSTRQSGYRICFFMRNSVESWPGRRR